MSSCGDPAFGLRLGTTLAHAHPVAEAVAVDEADTSGSSAGVKKLLWSRRLVRAVPAVDRAAQLRAAEAVALCRWRR